MLLISILVDAYHLCECRSNDEYQTSGEETEKYNTHPLLISNAKKSPSTCFFTWQDRMTRFFSEGLYPNFCNKKPVNGFPFIQTF